VGGIDTVTSGPAARHNPKIVNSICGQCHTAMINLEYANGAAVWNSREAGDMARGACRSQVRCTSCHDPHQAGPLDGAEKPAHAAACIACHPAYREPARIAQHTRHAAGSVSCLDCHMPRITQGLDSVIRTHLISSPTDERMLAAASLNACNLCHLDKPVTWTLTALRTRWGRAIEPAPDWQKKYGGDLEAPLGLTWLRSKDSSVRLVATDAYARSTIGKAMFPELMQALKDPIAVNRTFALLAAQRILGRKITREEFEATAPPADRAKQADALALKVERGK
jgi:hypothetical protein